RCVVNLIMWRIVTRGRAEAIAVGHSLLHLPPGPRQGTTAELCGDRSGVFDPNQEVGPCWSAKSNSHKPYRAHRMRTGVPAPSSPAAGAKRGRSAYARPFPKLTLLSWRRSPPR